MIELKRIISECFVDTLLVRLILDDNIPVHRSGITEVAKGVVEYEANDFVIGLIDTDRFKREPPAILKFTEEVSNLLDEQGLLIKKIPNNNRYVIRLHPAFERWIWKVATDNDVNTINYGYYRWQDIKDITKTEDVYKNVQLKNFIGEVVALNPPAIQTLRYWLTQATTENLF